MLLKTLTPCYFGYGWRSRALGTESQASWAVWVVMVTVPRISRSSTVNCGLFSPKALCTSCFLITHISRWKWSRLSPGPGPASVMIWKQKGIRLLFFKMQWRPFASTFVFSTQNFWTRELKNPLINIQRISFFYKAHAYTVVLAWSPLFSTDSVVFLLIGKLQTICTPLLRSWDFFYIDDLASNMLSYW